MTKLLLFGAENVVDQVLMIVEDDYNRKEVEEEASIFLDAEAILEDSVTLDEVSYSFTPGRAYVG